MASPAENFGTLNLGQPTHIAQRSGSWFDATTWQGGEIPDTEAKVAINNGVSVIYDGQNDAALHSIEVDGQLQFAANVNTKLVVETLAVSERGRLEIGTRSNPITAKAEVLIAGNGPLDLSGDPQQLGRGIVSEGRVDIHGTAKTSHLKVASDPRAGDRTLQLQSTPVNWQVGDRLVLTGTRFTPGGDGQSWDTLVQDEEVIIQSISGNQITLDRPLRYDHTTPRGDLKAYVANQSRSVLIATQNGDQLPPAQRGHTLFTGNAPIDIRYAEFRDLGRTDKTKPVDDFQTTGGVFPQRIGNNSGQRQNIAGRYAAQLYQTGKNTPAVMVGNVVDGSEGWGFVVRDSNALLEQNVAHDIAGGAFVTVNGNEKGAFRNNISINTGSRSLNYNEKQGTGTHDFARTGVGFWLQGRLMELEGNVAASSRGSGIFYFHRGVDLIPISPADFPVPEIAKNRLTSSTISVEQPPIQGFKNNEVFASGYGLRVIKDFPAQNHDLRTVMEGFKGWEVENGTELQYTAHYTLKDFDLISSRAARSYRNKGMILQRNTQDIVFTDMRADGFDKGISAQTPDNSGPTPIADRELVWVDLQLANNAADFENFTLPPEKWLRSSDLNFGRLEFQISDDSDFLVTTDEVKDYIAIRGTKIDSLGAITTPFSDEKLTYNYQDIIQLASKGYYTLPDGRRGTIIEEYFTDRVTGEIKKYPFVVTFRDSLWTQNSPYLGELDPSRIGGPTTVSLPPSRFSSVAQRPTPIAIASPANENLLSQTESFITSPLESSLPDTLAPDDSLLNRQGISLPESEENPSTSIELNNSTVFSNDANLLASVDNSQSTQLMLGSTEPEIMQNTLLSNNMLVETRQSELSGEISLNETTAMS
ncbi:MAG: G8 domain-containing protein [Phormidesmis sp.]